MIVLGIDTSGYANAVGVADGERILADSIFPARTDSLEKIISNIDSVLKEANLCLEDVQGFGVGLGPGSWTGIKVGVTVAKILAYSAGKLVCWCTYPGGSCLRCPKQPRSNLPHHLRWYQGYGICCLLSY